MTRAQLQSTRALMTRTLARAPTPNTPPPPFHPISLLSMSALRFRPPSTLPLLELAVHHRRALAAAQGPLYARSAWEARVCEARVRDCASGCGSGAVRWRSKPQRRHTPRLALSSTHRTSGPSPPRRGMAPSSACLARSECPCRGRPPRSCRRIRAEPPTLDCPGSSGST